MRMCNADLGRRDPGDDHVLCRDQTCIYIHTHTYIYVYVYTYGPTTTNTHKHEKDYIITIMKINITEKTTRIILERKIR